MRIFCSLPVPRSLAETFRMPLASMSKVTSICGIAARRRPDALEVELAQQPIARALGDRALALEDADRHRRLVVRRRREGLLLRRRDGRVALDQLGQHAAQGLDAQRQRRHVEQQHVRLAAQQQLRPLDGGADGDHFVRVDALVAFLAEDVLDQLLDLRHARHAADQHDLVDVARLVAGVLQGLSAPARGSARSGDRPAARTWTASATSAGASARDASAVMNGRLMSVVVCCDRSFLARSAGFLEPLQGHLVLAQIDAVLLLELVGDVVDQHLVEVVAAQVRVAVDAP